MSVPDLKKLFCLCSIIDVEHKAPITSQKLRGLGWEPRKLEETLSDSVECYEKAGLLQDSTGRPFRLPHLFRLAGDQ
jgi:hypothetical protein